VLAAGDTAISGGRAALQFDERFLVPLN